MDHDLGENQSAFSISLFCLDDWTRSNLTLVKNLESISFVSPLWKPMRRMKTPWKRNRKMYKKFVGFTNWHESRVSGLGWNLTRDWGNQNASFFCNTCHSIDNAESVGFQDIAERTRDKSNLHPKSQILIYQDQDSGYQEAQAQSAIEYDAISGRRDNSFSLWHFPRL